MPLPRGDVVGRFLTQTLRLSPIGGFLMALSVVVVAHLAAIAYYWAVMRERLDDFLRWQFGEWYVFVAFWVAYPLVGSFYAWSMRASTTIYAKLKSDGILPASSSNEIAGIKQMNASNWWPIGVLVVAITLEVSVLADGFQNTFPRTPYIGSDYWVFYVIGAIPNLLGLYIIGTMAGRYVTTIGGLRRIFGLLGSGPTSFLNPWHPDKVGGLGALSTYSVTMTWFVAAVGLLMMLLAFQSFVLISGIESISAGVWITLAKSLFLNPSLWIFLLLYVVMAPLLFFLTLGAAHGAMRRAKEEHLRLISRRLNESYSAVHHKLQRRDGSSLGVSVKPVKDLQDLYRMAEAFPVWPFDFITIRRFALAYVFPLFTISLSFELQHLLSF